MNSSWLVALGLSLCALAGCATPARVAESPAAAERCAFGSGVFRAGLCDYCR
jgi:hypothetical protein